MGTKGCTCTWEEMCSRTAEGGKHFNIQSTFRRCMCARMYVCTGMYACMQVLGKATISHPAAATAEGVRASPFN